MRGTWPAFWLSPGIDADGNTGWPPEIDIMEGALNDKYDTHNMLRMGAQAQNWGGERTASAPLPMTYSVPAFGAGDRKLRAAETDELRREHEADPGEAQRDARPSRETNALAHERRRQKGGHDRLGGRDQGRDGGGHAVFDRPPHSAQIDRMQQHAGHAGGA